MQQDGQLSVRQREGLRRAFAAAAGVFGWVAIDPGAHEPVDAATKDLMKLAERGARCLDGELAAELAEKKTETSRLKQVAKTISKMAAKGDFDEPVEVPYCHTAKEGSQRRVTKMAKFTLTNPSEAEDAARTIEKNLEGWEKLRVEMISELKGKQKELTEMKKTLPSLLQSHRGLLTAVLTAVQ
jgi:hypothetical protein